MPRVAALRELLLRGRGRRGVARRRGPGLGVPAPMADRGPAAGCDVDIPRGTPRTRPSRPGRPRYDDDAAGSAEVSSKGIAKPQRARLSLGATNAPSGTGKLGASSSRSIERASFTSRRTRAHQPRTAASSRTWPRPSSSCAAPSDLRGRRRTIPSATAQPRASHRRRRIHGRLTGDAAAASWIQSSARGAAAAATWIFRRALAAPPRLPRGSPPRLPRGSSADEDERGSIRDAAAASWSTSRCFSRALAAPPRLPSGSYVPSGSHVGEDERGSATRPRASRGAAAAATRTVCRHTRRRRGRHLNRPRAKTSAGRSAAPSRRPRGSSAGVSRRRRGCHADRL